MVVRMSLHNRAAALLATSLAALVVLPCLWVPSAASAYPSSDALADHVLSSSPRSDPAAALRSFSAYTNENMPGMALGKQKGDLIEVAVAKGLPPSGPAVVLEMGCHAGDGTLSALTAVWQRSGSTLLSTETNPEWMEATEKILGHVIGNNEHTFVPLLLNEGEGIDQVAVELSKHGVSQIDAVIFDDDEFLFLGHLQALLEKKFLRPGATIYVDNVKRKAKALKSYMQFVRSEAGNGFLTEVHKISEPYPDKVAISTFVGTGGTAAEL